MRLARSELFAAVILLSTWAGSAQQVVILFPHGTPEPSQIRGPERDVAKHHGPESGAQITDVSVPTMTVYRPPLNDLAEGAAAVVFPGGGYQFLGVKAAGTDACEWLNSLGITCFLVKYRVPQRERFPETYAPFEDAQQAVRLIRSHAGEWKIDPHKIGVMGFSAGGHLAVLMSTHPDDPHVMGTLAAQDVPMNGPVPVEARVDFAIVCWPAYLAIKPQERALDPIYQPGPLTPPTFLIQAEDDPYHANAIVYYRELMEAKIRAELLFYQDGGHAFGMHPANFAAAHWTEVAADWLRYNGIIPSRTSRPVHVPPAEE